MHALLHFILFCCLGVFISAGNGFGIRVKKFAYTGKLQPGTISPTLPVPDYIQRPDYAIDGKPKRNDKSRLNPWEIEPLALDDIPRARVVGRIAREVSYNKFSIYLTIHSTVTDLSHPFFT